MKSLWKSRMSMAAGAALLASMAFGWSNDAQVVIDRAKDDRTLTVTYSGAAVRLVELRVNGRSTATRTVSDADTKGETNFSLDLASLEDGENKVEVRLFDATGAQVGIQRTVVVVDRSGSGPVFLEKPQRGATVMGNVQIALGLKREMRNVYVSFFVNDEFRALKNFPPYTYMWDTTRYPNGWHEVQAWVVDAGDNTFKTERVRVFVNNPGGRTDRRTGETVPPTGPTSNPGADLTVTGNTTTATTGAATGLRSAQPNSQPVGSNPTLVSPQERATPVANPASVTTTAASGAKMPMLAGGTSTGPRTMLPTGQRVVGPRTSEATSTPTPRSGAPAIPPGTDPATNPDTVALAPESDAVRAVTNIAPAATMVRIGYGTRLPDVGTYSIYLNGQMVKFDVVPRVQDGVPLTPFRHLFETAGAEVKWIGDSKEVEAKGEGFDIWLKIGDTLARINDRELRLELAPFIDSGRTIVPLSFVQETLNVVVQYDAATGHVLITSNRAR